MKIHNQKHGNATKDDFLEIARLLIKFGYTVRITKTKNIKPNPPQVQCVELFGDENDRVKA